LIKNNLVTEEERNIFKHETEKAIKEFFELPTAKLLERNVPTPSEKEQLAPAIFDSCARCKFHFHKKKLKYNFFLVILNWKDKSEQRNPTCLNILNWVYKLDEIFFSVEISAFALYSVLVAMPIDNIFQHIDLNVPNLDLQIALSKFLLFFFEKFFFNLNLEQLLIGRNGEEENFITSEFAIQKILEVNSEEKYDIFKKLFWKTLEKYIPKVKNIIFFKREINFMLVSTRI
jgi:hypothetical protein